MSTVNSKILVNEEGAKIRFRRLPMAEEVATFLVQLSAVVLSVRNKALGYGMEGKGLNVSIASRKAL